MRMIIIEPYDPSWPDAFQRIGQQIRQALGARVLAIHHIGSTSVPGLPAKNIIDIQLTVAKLSDEIRDPLTALGFFYRADIQGDHCPPGMDIAPEDLTKRYYQLAEPSVNLHVRVKGRFNQRYAVLCRDYLRVTPMATNAYAEIKRQLAGYFPNDVDAYYDIKDPVFDVIMAGAFYWAELTGWQLPESDI
jgi:GrpB-like predicted nucleotidyltransferase (UPF0157 family)